MSQPGFAPSPLHFDQQPGGSRGTNRCVDWTDYPALFQGPSRKPTLSTVRADREPPVAMRTGHDIHEAFLGFCQALLLRPDFTRFDRPSERSAVSAAHTAAESFGFTSEEIRRLGCGLYPSPAAVREYLRGVGFSDREIELAGLICDATGRPRVELAGNLVVPLADENGRGRDYLLVSIDERRSTFASYRYLFGAAASGIVAHGLDAALVPARVENALVLVEDILEAFLLQCRGIHNVAAIGGRGRDLSPARWEALSGLGIETVVLAFRQDERYERNIRDALVNALRGRIAPEVYVANTYPAYEESPLNVLRRFGRETCARALYERTLAFHQKDFRGVENEASLNEEEIPAARRDLEPYYRTAFRRHLNDLVSALPAEYRLVQERRLVAVEEAICAAEWRRLRHLVSGHNFPEPDARNGAWRESASRATTTRANMAASVDRRKTPARADRSWDGINDGNGTFQRHRRPQEGEPLAETRFHDFPASEADIQKLLSDWEQRELENAGAI